MSGANVFNKQPPLRQQHWLMSFDAVSPPPQQQQHWLMSFVAVSPSPNIRLMSVGLSDIRVVEARLRRAWPLNMRTALEKSSRPHD
jgi:hypothetical protein